MTTTHSLEDIDNASRYLFGVGWPEVLYRHQGGRMTDEQFDDFARRIAAFLNATDKDE